MLSSYVKFNQFQILSDGREGRGTQVMPRGSEERGGMILADEICLRSTQSSSVGISSGVVKLAGNVTGSSFGVLVTGSRSLVSRGHFCAQSWEEGTAAIVRRYRKTRRNFLANLVLYEQVVCFLSMAPASVQMLVLYHALVPLLRFLGRTGNDFTVFPLGK